jgi:trehalose-6-phosphate synthase
MVRRNHDPYVHRLEGEDLVCERPISGLVTALDPVMRACGGTWVAHGGGNADRDVVAVATHQARCADEVERRARMAALRETVSQTNRYRWADKIVSELGRIAARRALETAG